jgi:hypothetical protein
MAALLDAIRRLPPNGFALWDAAAHVTLGREPSSTVALAIAERIVTAFAPTWPRHARTVITPQRIVSALASCGDTSVFSPRPALIAYVAGLVGGVQTEDPEEMLIQALRDPSVKLM